MANLLVDLILTSDDTFGGTWADILGMSQAAIRKRLSRAKRRLYRTLKPTEIVGEVIPITEARGGGS